MYELRLKDIFSLMVSYYLFLRNTKIYLAIPYQWMFEFVICEAEVCPLNSCIHMSQYPEKNILVLLMCSVVVKYQKLFFFFFGERNL